MRTVLVLWLVGWAVFGCPWTGFTMDPGFHRISLVPFRRGRRRDDVLNFLYYVPLGAVGIGLGWPVPVTIGAAAALSGTTEFVQIFSTTRFPSVTDVLLNVGGAVVGVSAMVSLKAWRRERSLRARIHRC